MYLNNNNYN